MLALPLVKLSPMSPLNAAQTRLVWESIIGEDCVPMAAFVQPAFIAAKFSHNQDGLALYTVPYCLMGK
jgi:hypothetical protein